MERKDVRMLSSFRDLRLRSSSTYEVHEEGKRKDKRFYPIKRSNEDDEIF